jgi:hypothetical protein
MRVSLTRTGHNSINEYVNAVCIMPNFAYACWLLRDFSDQCEDIRLDDGQICSCLSLFLLRDFL